MADARAEVLDEDVQGGFYPGAQDEKRGSRAFDAFIFDLDGTLLNTLPDLVEITNATLRECGYPERTHDEILSFVGSGVRALIRLAAPAGADDADVDRAAECWKRLYPDYGYRLTRPYPGIEPMLSELKAAGVKLGVLSNKFDEAAKEVIGVFLPDIFDAVHGESPDYPRKPDPTGLSKMLAGLGSSADRCVFVGDSSNDILVARAAGAYSVGVTWGYGAVDVLLEDGADKIIDQPAQLLELLSR